MKRSTVIVVALLVGAVLGAWYVLGQRSVGIRVGATLSEFRLMRLPQGDTVALVSAYRDHVTLVNLWATWCIPCKEEMPSLERLYQRFTARGFRIAAVSAERATPERVLQFARDLGVTFDVLLDQSEVIQDQYASVGLPHSLLLDTKGRIVMVQMGATAWDTPAMIARIDSLLGAH